GVCGDARYVRDFATAQTAQTLLDLYEVSQDKTHLDAAVLAAKLYINAIYTRPIASQEEKTVNGKTVEDWEISQSGLSFEHGGMIGSANPNGPILLSSHAGLFIRMFGLTGEQIFADM